jgi:hypothetical protein
VLIRCYMRNRMHSPNKVEIHFEALFWNFPGEVGNKSRRAWVRKVGIVTDIPKEKLLNTIQKCNRLHKLPRFCDNLIALKSLRVHKNKNKCHCIFQKSDLKLSYHRLFVLNKINAIHTFISYLSQINFNIIFPSSNQSRIYSYIYIYIYISKKSKAIP